MLATLFAPLLGFFARSALMQSPIGTFLKAMPRWAWIALAAIALLGAGIIWHQGRAHAAIATAVKSAVEQRDQQWRAAIAKAHADALKAKAARDAAAAKISTTLKGQHDAQIDHDAAAAGDLQLRGPGKAAASCRPGDHPGVPAAASGLVGAGGAAAAAAGPVPSADGVSGLPASDYAVVPWSWLVDQARQADDTRDEALKWRDWYAQQFNAWEAARRAAPDPDRTGPHDDR